MCRIRKGWGGGRRNGERGKERKEGRENEEEEREREKEEEEEEVNMKIVKRSLGMWIYIIIWTFQQ